MTWEMKNLNKFEVICHKIIKHIKCRILKFLGHVMGKEECRSLQLLIWDKINRNVEKRIQKNLGNWMQHNQDELHPKSKQS